MTIQAGKQTIATQSRDEVIETIAAHLRDLAPEGLIEEWRRAELAPELVHVEGDTFALVENIIPDDFEMLSPEGNLAVRQACLTLDRQVRSGDIETFDMLVAAIGKRMDAISEKYPEVHDTEPQWAVSDALTPASESRSRDGFLGWKKLARDW